MAIYSEFYPLKMVDLSIVMLVYQRVSIEKKKVAVLHIYGHIYGVFFIYLDLLT